MKKYVLIFIMNIILFLLQTTLFDAISIGNVVPNLMVVITSAAGLLYGEKAGMFSGVVSGVLIDFMYSDTIGLCIFIYALIGFLNGKASRIYYKEDLYLPMLSMTLSDLLYGALYYLFFFLLAGRLQIVYFACNIMLPEMVYTLLVGLILYKFLLWIDRRMYPPAEVPLRDTMTER